MAGNKNVSILEKSVKIIGEICSDGVFDTSKYLVRKISARDKNIK